MSGNMNKVLLEGNISKIETKEVGDGKKVTDLQLAVNGGYKGKDGKWVPETSYVPVKKWGLSDKQLEVLTVGKGLRIEGEIKTDIFETKDGKKGKNVYVSMDSFEFTSGPKKEKGQEKKVDEPEHVF